MPFKLGPAPIRRTLGYLQSGKLVFKDRVKVLCINYNDDGDHHKGARDFVFWNMCQVVYRNPDVHVVAMRNCFPNPFLRIWFDNGKDIIVDVFAKNHLQIMDHLVKILGKNEDQMLQSEDQKNSVNFGSGCERHCMCEVIGQVPCSGVVPPPKHMTGRYRSEHGLFKRRIPK